MKRIAIFVIRGIKKIALKLNTIENSANCNKKTKSQGVNFLPEARVNNSKNNPEDITIGIGTYLRGELTTFNFGGNIKIGKNCYIGEGTRIWSGKKVAIGDDVLISHNVNIMDTDSHEVDYLKRAETYSKIVSTGYSFEQGEIKTAAIEIKNHVWIGFNSVILKGITIGEGAIVAAGSVVTKDVAPWTVVGGNPAKFLKEIPDNLKKR